MGDSSLSKLFFLRIEAVKIASRVVSSDTTDSRNTEEGSSKGRTASPHIYTVYTRTLLLESFFQSFIDTYIWCSGASVGLRSTENLGYVFAPDPSSLTMSVEGDESKKMPKRS